MSDPPPHNRVHEYNNSSAKTQKIHPSAGFWSALPVRLGPLRRFLVGARPSGRLPLLPDARSVHTGSHSFTLVHNKKSFSKFKNRCEQKRFATGAGVSHAGARCRIEQSESHGVWRWRIHAGDAAGVARERRRRFDLFDANVRALSAITRRVDVRQRENSQPVRAAAGSETGFYFAPVDRLGTEGLGGGIVGIGHADFLSDRRGVEAGTRTGFCATTLRQGRNRLSDFV